MKTNSPNKRRQHTKVKTPPPRLHSEDNEKNVALSVDLERLSCRHHVLSVVTVLLVGVIILSFAIASWIWVRKYRNHTTLPSETKTTDGVAAVVPIIIQQSKGAFVTFIVVAVSLFVVLGVVLFLKWNTTKDFMKMFSRTLPSQAIIAKKQEVIEKKEDKAEELEKQLLALQKSVAAHEENIEKLKIELANEKSIAIKRALQIQIASEQKAITSDNGKIIKGERLQDDALDQITKLRRELVELEKNNAILMKKLTDAGIPLMNPDAHTVEELRHEIEMMVDKIRSGGISENDETYGAKLTMWQEALNGHKDTIAAKKKERADWEQANIDNLKNGHDKTLEAYDQTLLLVPYEKLIKRWPVFKLLKKSAEHIKVQAKQDFVDFNEKGLSLDELLAIYARFPKDGFTKGVAEKEVFKDKVYTAILNEQEKVRSGKGATTSALEKLALAHRNVSTTPTKPVFRLAGVLKKNVHDGVAQGAKRAIGKLSPALLANGSNFPMKLPQPPPKPPHENHEKQPNVVF